MAKKLISFNFNGEFCKELEVLRQSYKTSEVYTEYCTTPSTRISEYNTETYIAEAVCNYINKINTMHLFVAKTSRNEFVCEYQKPGKTDTQICIGKINGDGKFTFKAGNIDADGLLKAYDEGHKGTQFLMAMMPVILKDHEATSFLDVLQTYELEEENFSQAMCGLSNNIYYRVKDEKSTAPVRYENDIKKLTQSDIDDVTVVAVYTGTANIFSRISTGSSSEEVKPLTSSIKAAEMRDMYRLNDERTLTAEEEKRVPNLGDWYVVPEWSKHTAKRISNSNRFRKNIRNILLYGPSGTGKTEGSQAIAEMLGLPYYSITCSADDDKFDLIGQLIPNTEKGKSAGTTDEICNSLDIPTFEDVENDFSGSFEKLFGRKPGKFDTEADAFQEITRKLLENKSQDENDFVYVESELIQAIKTGGFCEIQEANIIKRSSVMEALNPLLAGGEGFIKLPTGEIIKRHPDCVIAFTINRDYEGTNDIQEAVYSRINMIKQIPEPTEAELFDRTKAQTGFANDALLRKMSKCIVDIHEYCREKDISGGVCGPRELLDWAMVAMLESEDREEDKVSETSVIVAALETILEKAAQNADDIEDIIVGVFNKHFSPSKVNELRK